MQVKAVIFDMDGVLVNSEPLWRRAMIKGFEEVGLILSEADCRKTLGMRFDEVIAHWFRIQPWALKTPEKLHDDVIDHLCELIAKEGKEMPGVSQALTLCKENGMAIGLATSSSTKLIEAVLNKLEIRSHFHAITSAEHIAYGKPHPQVFLDCAQLLATEPMHCLVIEDSLNGVIAGKSARMKVIAIPDEEHKSDTRFCLADYNLNSLKEFSTEFFN